MHCQLQGIYYPNFQFFFLLLLKFYISLKAMQRDRPLQNSMFLPQPSNSTNRRPSIPMEYNFPLPNVRKVGSGYNNSQSHYQHQNVIVQQNRQIIQTNSFEQGNQMHRVNQNSLHEIYTRLDNLAKAVDKHQSQLTSLYSEGQFSKRIVNDLKKNLPVFTGGNDVYDHILTQKLEIKQLQDEIIKIPKINDLEQLVKKQIQASTKLTQSNASSNLSMTGLSSSKSNEVDPMLSDMLKKRDEFFQNMIGNLETEVSILKKNLSNMSMEMKVSPITSNSCIMLKYQQLFKARNKGENDIILSESTYYIDNEGHLLDCHSRYIVDQKGKKIKLQEKHLAMLRGQKILL